MPSDPSTNCATRPTIANSRKLTIYSVLPLFILPTVSILSIVSMQITRSTIEPLRGCVKPLDLVSVPISGIIFEFLKIPTQIPLTRRPACSRVSDALLTNSVGKESKRGERYGATQCGDDRGGHVPQGSLGGLRQPVHQHASPGRVRALVGGFRPARGLFVPHHAGPRRHADGDVLLHAHGLGAFAAASYDVARRALQSWLPHDGGCGHAVFRSERLRL